MCLLLEWFCFPYLFGRVRARKRICGLVRKHSSMMHVAYNEFKEVDKALSLVVFSIMS